MKKKKKKLTVQLIERMNATRKLTMGIGQVARFKFKIKFELSWDFRFVQKNTDVTIS